MIEAEEALGSLRKIGISGVFSELSKAFLAGIGVGILILVVFLVVRVFHHPYPFAVVIPYLAFAAFLGGFIYRFVRWGSSYVPFRIPTTCGQEISLPWVRRSLMDKIDNPSNTFGVIVRMALEILAFRSLFRGEKTELKGEKLIYGGRKYLWGAALAFHWSLLVILFRHLRFFTEPTPYIVYVIQNVDGIFEIILAELFITDILILSALTFLFLRRVILPQLRYISLFSDHFAVLLIFSVALSGVLMRCAFDVDIAGVKELALSMLGFHPALPEEGLGFPFYVHLFLACALFAYFPYSKLMHMAGVFLSPTRNPPNDTRLRRHVNPWNYPVKTRSYEEYEDEFREVMKKAGVPLEKEE